MMEVWLQAHPFTDQCLTARGAAEIVLPLGAERSSVSAERSVR